MRYHRVMESAEEGDAFTNIVDVEDAGVEPIVEVCRQVGDFVGEVDELRFERRAEVEEDTRLVPDGWRWCSRASA